MQRASILLVLVTALLFAAPAVADAQDLYEIKPGALFLNGCIGPSPCDCAATVIGTLSGTFELHPLLPPLGPIFEYNVVGFAGVVDDGTPTPIVITGSGTVVVDVVANTQNWTLDLDVAGVPHVYTSLLDAPLTGSWLLGELEFSVFTLDMGCSYDGLQMQAQRIQEFVRGDCNDDAAFNVADVIFHLIWLFASGPGAPCHDACDANDDGGLNLADAVVMLQTLFSGAGPLPAPHVVCGHDPTGDTTGCLTFASCP